mmetsp:Transcript_3593/g.7266  ORF Transcript_3593/g.7266 Transcript_3593/m.7266 type:complete len:92 (-) Transcript_3593:1775-2050(-)
MTIFEMLRGSLQIGWARNYRMRHPFTLIRVKKKTKLGGSEPTDKNSLVREVQGAAEVGQREVQDPKPVVVFGFCCLGAGSSEPADAGGFLV